MREWTVAIWSIMGAGTERVPGDGPVIVDGRCMNRARVNSRWAIYDDSRKQGQGKRLVLTAPKPTESRIGRVEMVVGGRQRSFAAIIGDQVLRSTNATREVRCIGSWRAPKVAGRSLARHAAIISHCEEECTTAYHR